MLGRISRMRSIGAAFAKAKEGTSAILLALVLPTLAGIAGFAADYSAASNGQQRLQAVVDSTALAIAREMTVTPVDNTRVQALAEQYVAANIPANTPYKILIAASLAEANLAVKVIGQQQVATPFGLLERFSGLSIISASALARVTASSAPQKVCMVSLGEAIDGGIFLHNGSFITAPGCLLHSNSTKPEAIIINAGSTLKAGLVCARGGVKNMAGVVDSALVSDCPAMIDPLATKPEPVVSNGCDFNKVVIDKGITTIKPGTYCSGLEITGTAKVTMEPGIYHFNNGHFYIKATSEVRGNGVTLLFNGKKSFFRFEESGLVEISAPVSGPTAGMLIWELKGFVPSGTTQTNTTSKTKNSNEHHISSDRARQLTGTIYLKKGLLMIDSKKPIADLSPYTILVVNKLDLYDGPNLVLNSNYSGTAVPVPAGLGPIGATKIRLGM